MDFELKIEVRELPISEIVENRGQIPDVPKNPRKISKERFDALCESIRMSPEMKVLDEVRVYPYDGKYVVIGGNHRFRAYKTLGWKNVLCKVLPEDTPKEKLREYVIKDNMQYAENDTRLLSDWDVKELVAWDVPMAVKKGKGAEDVGDVEFTEVLDECHNYVVLYFDNEVDWLQAQTLLGLKPVKLFSTSRQGDNVHAKATGIGRVLRGADVFNRLMKNSAMLGDSNKNKKKK